MNEALSHPLRGSRAIAEVIERMNPLADWLSVHKPECRVLTLRRRDLDLLLRWPAASAHQQIHIIDGVAWWRGLILRADKTAPRYNQRFAPMPPP